jgi:signal transduction histidine kinase
LYKFSEAGLEAQIVGGPDILKDAFPFARTVFYFIPGQGLVLPKPGTPDYDFLQPLLRNRLGYVWDPPNRMLQRYLVASFQGNLRPGNGPMKGAPPPISSNVPNGNVSNNGGNLGADDGNAILDADAKNLTGAPGGSPLNLAANNDLAVPQIVIQFPDGNTVDISSAFSNGFGQNFANATWQGLHPNVFSSEVQDSVTKITGADPGQTQIISSQQTLTVVTSKALTETARPEQGWVPVYRNNDFHWLGWMRETPNSSVRGVLLSWETLEKSMSTAFPEKLGAADGFILRNPTGKAIVARFANGAMLMDNHSNDPVDDANAKPTFKPTITLPIGSTMTSEMPGWSLEVYFNPEAKFSSNFMALSTVLVTVLVISVLVGGTLLMREARREAFDAARKTSFVSNVSHELKTPLTTIRMYAELLGEGRVRDPAKQRTYLTTIISESQRLTRLVNNVLDFSRLEQGRKQYHPDNVPLAEVVQSVLNTQHPRLEEAGFQVETDLSAAADLHVHTDRDALEQVLLNLIDNALKYAAEGHWLGVRISRDAEHAILSVSDHGPGVPADEQERIFAMFHRVDDSITARLPGAGLGLSIARRLLRDQEGDLHYVPNAPCGASFVASLPLAVSAEKTAPAPV